MKIPFVKLDTFLSNDRKYIFSRCQLEFTSTTIGDFDQITLTNTLIGAFEDLAARLSKYKLKACTLNNVEDEFIGLLEKNILNSCLPIGVENFDGDQAAFFVIENMERMILKPWGAKTLSFEIISLDDYKKEIAAITTKLESQKRRLTPKLFIE
ncbi:hypothetical protein [Pseudomonas fluorescens]|uniref:hypothetical protein n=1 Tax=Pseudomonas fluorescens TaxID=294 RepID=UPI00099A5D7D|nr:hypothetical protein [Pseudomonas fluorescens]OPB32866.1 hypothetical protein BFW90_08840 [Pseudomonas fluorescens]